MPAVIHCPSCQKEYPWKPDLAGKRVKCKCGQTIEVPVGVPTGEIDELYDLADDGPKSKPQHAIADLQSVATTAAVAVDDSHQFPCPYCGEKLDPGSMMCLFCGSDLQGALPANAVRTVQTAQQAAPPVAHRPVVMRAETREEKSGKLKLVIGGILALVVMIGAVVAIKRALPARQSEAALNLRPADAAIQQVVDGNSAAEAREWLKANDGHALSGLSHKQSQFKVDQWYELGAKSVYVLTNGTSVAIELPGESLKRKAIFEWQEKWNAENNFKNSADEGQKWLEIQMHL